MAERVKKQKTRGKYPMQPMLIPVGQQPVVYPPPVYAQPQPVYRMHPQYQYPMVPNIAPVPQTRNPVVAVPIGPPIGPPVVLTPQAGVSPTPVPAPIPTPIPAPIPAPIQTPVPPPQPIIIQQAPPQVNKTPTVVIKRYIRKDDDCCCNIF